MSAQDFATAEDPLTRLPELNLFEKLEAVALAFVYGCVLKSL